MSARTVLAGVMLGLVCGVSVEAAPRSSAAVAQFKRMSPCPATGGGRGPCPGYVVDHVEPLCAGGLDVPANMQWQEAQAAKAKDVDERRLCRALKREAR